MKNLPSLRVKVSKLSKAGGVVTVGDDILYHTLQEANFPGGDSPCPRLVPTLVRRNQDCAQSFYCGLAIREGGSSQFFGERGKG